MMPAAPEAAVRSNVAALIPAFLEETLIADVVRRSLFQLDHVVVVDDGSADATASRAESAGAEVIRHPVNSGKGAAIKTGLRALTARGFLYCLILDGDGQHLPEEIPRFLGAANETHSHLLVGNRMSDTRTMPFVRRMTNSFMSGTISRLCGQPIPDTQCGFRMIHADLAPHLDCPSNAYEYETEMLLIAARRGFRISPVPITTIYGDEKSKIRPVRDTIRFLRLIRRYSGGKDGAAQG
jgi:glycosyltransferase involved in cell wall biosynthesis